jgi:3-oxoacyl-[acyl-carrier-protein] synthase-1
MTDAAVIVSVGACTAVGRGAWSSAAAVRAGVSGFCEHPFLIDTAGQPMRGAIAPWIDIHLGVVDRLEALLFPALDEALEPLAPTFTPSGAVAIALALPAARPGLPDDLQAQLVKRISKRYGQQINTVAAFAAGHAAGLVGLHAACARLREGKLDACVVAGVDSLIVSRTLEWLESCDQLHGAGALNNAWGFIPGEAGAALLLMRESAARRAGLPVLATVLGSATALESKLIKTDAVCIGEGLTQAFLGALAALPERARVSDVYCDMNGEPYRADEYGFACLRTGERFEAASDFVAPADCWGDVAAAGAVLHVLLACVAGHKGYANGPLAFACASSESGERAAVLMHTPGRA